MQTAVDNLYGIIERYIADISGRTVTIGVSDIFIGENFIQRTETLQRFGADFSGSVAFMQSDRPPTFKENPSTESISCGGRV